jgi:hypothetical protein
MRQVLLLHRVALSAFKTKSTTRTILKPKCENFKANTKSKKNYRFYVRHRTLNQGLSIDTTLGQF